MTFIQRFKKSYRFMCMQACSHTAMWHWQTFRKHAGEQVLTHKQLWAAEQQYLQSIFVGQI